VLRVDDPEMGAAGVVKHRRPEAERDAQELVATPHPGDLALCRQLFEATGTFTCRAADIDTFRGWLQPAYLRYLELHPPDALILVPLRARGHLIGALAVAREQATWGNAREDVLLLQEFADRAALVIENARLFSAMQHAIKSRGDVIAAVSHDVANPLNAIVAGSTLLLMNEEAPSRERMLTVIKRSAEHASRIMRDLLDTAAVDVGKLTVVAAPVRIAQLIADAGEAFELAARAAGIVLTTAVDDAMVRADRDRVVQVIANLLANAIKFTPPRRPHRRGSLLLRRRRPCDRSRHWSGDCESRASACLRPLLPGGSRCARWCRPGAGHLQKHRHGAWRTHLGPERPEQGQLLHLLAAAGGNPGA
jgi:signal transduction histidine kinase